MRPCASSPRLAFIAAVCTMTLGAIAAPAGTRAHDPLDPARAALRSLQFAKALEILGPLARANADAQYLLGLMALNGIGMAPDAKLARELLTAAAAQDNATAAFVLAGELGRDGAAARALSRHWLERSAQLGYGRALEVLKSGRALYAADFAGATDPSLLAAWAIECARTNNAAELARLGRPAAEARDAFGRTALSHAAAAGSLAAAAALLEAGADVQAVDSSGTSALMLAAQRPSAEMVTFLLQRGADARASDADGRTPLFYAARANRTQPMLALLQAGAALDARDSRNYNALDAALAVGASAGAEELRRAGSRATLHMTVAQRPAGRFDPAHPGDVYRGWQPLALAVARDDAPSVGQLLDAGADVQLRVPQGDPLLIVAADAHALTCVPVLLKRGAEAGTAGHSGHGVLWLAAARGDLPLVNALLAAGVKPDTHAPDEDQPLLTAVRAGYVDIAAALMSAGAAVDGRDALGRTPLMLAAAGAQQGLVDSLLLQHAQLEARDRLGRTAAWYASLAGSPAVVALLAAGADAAACDSAGLSVLHAAALQSDARVLEPLFKANIDLNVRSRSGDSALIVAAAAGHAGVVRALLAQSPQLDIQNGGGDTALIAASREGFADICRLLVSAGANRAIRNRAGLSAADAAASRGFTALAKDILGNS